jgi:hypothetical protein
MYLSLRKHNRYQHSAQHNRHRRFLSPILLWMLLVLSLSNLALKVRAQTLKAESPTSLKRSLSR